MALRKVADLAFESGPHSIGLDPDSGEYSLTRPGGEDPYGVEFSVPAAPGDIPAAELVRALGQAFNERDKLEAEAAEREAKLKADLAEEKQRVANAARVGSGT